jgi:cation transport ATPase
MAKTQKLLFKLRKALEQLKSADLVLFDDDGTVVVLTDVETQYLTSVNGPPRIGPQ